MRLNVPKVWPWTQDWHTDGAAFLQEGQQVARPWTRSLWPKGGFCLGGEEVLPVLHEAVVFTLAPGKVGSCWALSCVALDEQLCSLEPGWVARVQVTAWVGAPEPAGVAGRGLVAEAPWA